jgi:hypothetical protein
MMVSYAIEPQISVDIGNRLEKGSADYTNAAAVALQRRLGPRAMPAA